jgi:hypothetical protein
MSDLVNQARDHARGEQYLASVKNGTTMSPDSPGGKSLLASYKRWQQGETEKASDVKSLAALQVSLENIEGMLATTVKELSKAMRAALVAGTPVGTTLTEGFQVYKQAGGKLTPAAWRRDVWQR